MMFHTDDGGDDGNDSYADYVVSRLGSGEIVRYGWGDTTVWVYERDGAYYRLSVTGSEYLGEEESASERQIRRAVRRIYPVEPATDDASHVVKRWAAGGFRGDVRCWYVDAGEMVRRIEDGDEHGDVSRMMEIGLKLAAAVDDDGLTEKLRSRVRTLGRVRDE